MTDKKSVNDKGGDYVAKVRRELGMTQQELSVSLGVSVATLRRVEASKGDCKPLYVLAVEALRNRHKAMVSGL